MSEGEALAPEAGAFVRRRRVVVTGLGAITPLGNDVASSWSACCAGRSGTRTITRFDPAALKCRVAAEVHGFELPSIVSAREARKMSTFVHYAIGATYEALRDSGLEINDAIRDDVGVSLGVGIGGLQKITESHNALLEQGPGKLTPYCLPMSLINMAAGHVSLIFDARGYNACSVSACASSAHAIGDAARIIERGDAIAMIAGGSEASVNLLSVGAFDAMRALSLRNGDPSRASRPYDRNRDGFVFGEGAATLILEEYEHARARGAQIYAELAGYGFSSDAHHMTAPSVEGPARAMRMAMRDARLDPLDLDYVNAHATSTPLGDVNELRSLKMALGEEAARRVNISATKGMTGHLLGASAAVEAVFTTLAIRDSTIPPTINIEELDPECDLNVTPNEAVSRRVSAAMSNSFGFGGTNAALVFKAMS